MHYHYYSQLCNAHQKLLCFLPNFEAFVSYISVAIHLMLIVCPCKIDPKVISLPNNIILLLRMIIFINLTLRTRCSCPKTFDSPTLGSPRNSTSQAHFHRKGGGGREGGRGGISTFGRRHAMKQVSIEIELDICGV
jgi:hypothetical protein